MFWRKLSELIASSKLLVMRGRITLPVLLLSIDSIGNSCCLCVTLTTTLYSGSFMGSVYRKHAFRFLSSTFVYFGRRLGRCDRMQKGIHFVPICSFAFLFFLALISPYNCLINGFVCSVIVFNVIGRFVCVINLFEYDFAPIYLIYVTTSVTYSV